MNIDPIKAWGFELKTTVGIVPAIKYKHHISCAWVNRFSHYSISYFPFKPFMVLLTTRSDRTKNNDVKNLGMTIAYALPASPRNRNEKRLFIKNQL